MLSEFIQTVRRTRGQKGFFSIYSGRRFIKEVDYFLSGLKKTLFNCMSHVEVSACLLKGP